MIIESVYRYRLPSKWLYQQDLKSSTTKFETKYPESVADPDWDSKDGHYRVRLDNQWIDVPDNSVITEPNRAGRTIVWPLRNGAAISIRCFMPGSMT